MYVRTLIITYKSSFLICTSYASTENAPIIHPATGLACKVSSSDIAKTGRRNSALTSKFTAGDRLTGMFSFAH